MKKKFKVYCLKDCSEKVCYIGATRVELAERFGRGYKTFDCSKLKIELIAEFDTEEQMFTLESMLIKHYGLANLLNKAETTSAGVFPKGFTHEKSFKKGDNGDAKYGEKRKSAIYEACRVEIECSNGEKYNSISEMCKELNLQSSNVNKVLKGLRTHTGGYTFKYASQANTEIDKK